MRVKRPRRAGGLVVSLLAVVTFGALACESSPRDMWIDRNPEAGADFDAPAREVTGGAGGEGGEGGGSGGVAGDTGGGGGAAGDTGGGGAAGDTGGNGGAAGDTGGSGGAGGN
jgi:hypothetical protein